MLVLDEHTIIQCSVADVLVEYTFISNDLPLVEIDSCCSQWTSAYEQQ